MSDINPERGEVGILLDGKVYCMRPTFSAIQQIERQLNTSLARLARMAVASELSLEHMAVIATEGIRASGDPLMKAVNAERVGDLIYRAGVMQSMMPILEFLGNAINGGKPLETAQGNDEAAGSSGTTTAD